MQALKMPKDIDDMPAAAIGPFTMRQVIGLILGGGIITLVWIFIKPYLSMDLCIGICVVTAIPALAIGFVPKSMLQGLYMEQFALMWLKYNVLRPTRRKYKIENPYDSICKTYAKREKQKQQLAVDKRSRAEKKKTKKFSESLKGVA